MKRIIIVGSVCLALLLVPAASVAQTADDDSDEPAAATGKVAKTAKNKSGKKSGKKSGNKKKKKKEARGLRFEFKNEPSLRVGNWLRTDFHVKFQHDFTSFDTDLPGTDGTMPNLKRFRVGVEGYVTKDFEYKVERELRGEVANLFDLNTGETDTVWRDAWVNYRHFRRFQIRVGQQKIPLGLDRLRGMGNSEFVFRSLIGTTLAPARDIGIVAHGKLFEQSVEYEAGAFLHDGTTAHLSDNSHSGQRTFAGRVVVSPLKLLPAPSFLKTFKDIELGVAATDSPVTEGLRSVRGKTWSNTDTFFSRMYVRGHRLRLGTELSWMPGPFFVGAEVIRMRDQRLGQGSQGEDLSNLISRGWYVSTGWVVTGEKKAGGVKPKREFITSHGTLGHGTGAIELAARYEQLRFGSSDHPGKPSRDNRAPNILSDSERAATFGVNWYLNRYVRVQFNAIREVLEDIKGLPLKGVDTYWSRYVRIQFVL